MLNEENKINRMKGIGASECAIIFGMVDYMSPYQLWLIKTGREQQKDLSILPQVEWGNRLEDVIARKYADVNQCSLEEIPETLYHPEFPFILCHLDRKIVGIDKILECKFAMGFTNDQWGEPGSTEVPMPYILQVQHQLAVTGYQYADLAVLISGYDFRIYHFQRDEEIIAAIIQKSKEFWGYVVSDVPPPLRDMEDAKLRWPFSNANYKLADQTVVESWEKLKQLKRQEKMIASEVKPLKDTIALYMQDSEGLMTESDVIATWKTAKDGSRRFLIKGV